jgi:hypothetical protein
VRPKYSIILPTLNGARTLAITLPAMLRTSRADVEWVLSENHSNDDTWSLLQSFALRDARIKLVRPPERLPLGKHLEFAYQQASGEWLSHLGDDDCIVPWRFELLDHLLNELDTKCRLIRGEYVRYTWPEFPEPQFSNSVDAAEFSTQVAVKSGREFARELLNRVHIHGGGAWVVHHELVQQVRAHCQWFASPQHVEFFAMRAAACLSEQVALVQLPLFVLGRHGKSSGSQYFLPRTTNQVKTWDWSFEDPQGYQSPFNWKSYSTLSLDAALAVQRAFPQAMDGCKIRWPDWLKAIHSEMMRLVAYEQLPPQARRDFLQALRSLPIRNRFYWRWRTWRLQWQHAWQGKASSADAGKKPTASDSHHALVWPERIHGATAGFDSIVSLIHWMEHSHQFHWHTPQPAST